MKTPKRLLNQTLWVLACIGLAVPSFANGQVWAEEVFGTVAVQEEVIGRGGASLVNKETGEVYSYDPDTGQRYTLEKLLELGMIPAEDYQVYVEARQATQVANEISSNKQTEMLQVAPEEKNATEISSQLSDANNSELKVLPKTSSTSSLVEVVPGCLLFVLAGLGIKKSRR